MFDPKVLLDQVIGGGTGGADGQASGRSAQPGFNPMGGGGSFAGGAAVGGLLGLLLGSGRPFELVLVQAMIGAAKADGHVDAEEQRPLFSEVERMNLDGEAKAFVFDALTRQADLAQLASAAAGEEQAAELYLASRLAIDPDHPAERAYLDALAARLRLPAELRAHLDKQMAD